MKSIFRYFIVFTITAISLILGLIFTATIPKEAISDHIEESARYLTEDPQNFHYTINGVDGSLRDQYADTILLSIAYYINPDNPVNSLIWDYYYVSPTEEVFVKNLMEAVKKDPHANTQYLRYWHGSLLIVRPLLTFMNIRQIYFFNSAVFITLYIWLMMLLIKNQKRVEAICFTIAMAAVNLWFVPFCLEYTWVFLTMLIASIGVVKLILKGRDDLLGYLFLITGIVCSFLDFLTTETVTLLIPMLLIARFQGQLKQKQFSIVKWTFLWAFGFIFMWVLKWLLASLYLNESVIPYIMNNALFQLGINTFMPPYMLAVIGIGKNFKTLAPFGYGLFGAKAFLVVIILFVIIPVMKNWIRIREKIEVSKIKLYLLLGILPYVRYLMLPFHTWHHYFFTYRAQASTVLAFCFVVLECIEINRPRITNEMYESNSITTNF